MQLLWRLSREAVRYKNLYVVAILSTLGLTIVNLAAPRVLSSMTGIVEAGMDESSLRAIGTLTAALIMLGVAVGAAVVVVVVVLCVHARTRKKMREEEEKLKRGRAENGKIDLDPFPDLGGSDGDEKNDKADGQGKRQ